MYRIMESKIDKINRLLKQDQKIFHTDDLAIIWEISNRNTLYTTIKRYVKSGVLIRIFKGLYSIVPVQELDDVYLGIKALHSYAYLSTETILAKHGVIAQSVNYITYVSGFSKKFRIIDQLFLSRQLKDEYLFNTAGIENVEGINTAILERAVADMLYFHPRYYFDGHNRINWTKVKGIQKKLGYYIVS